MDELKLLLWAVFVSAGSLLVGLSVPLIRGRVRPNHVYGFRTPRTRADPAVWYAANRYAAWRLLWVGVALVAAATTLAFVRGIGVAAYGWICLAVVVAGFAVALVQNFRQLRRLTSTP